MNDEPAFCEHCGSVSEKLTELLARKEEALTLIERDLRNKRAQVRRLQRERAGAAEASPLYPYARKAFDYWRSLLMPKAREFSDKRLAAVMARLAAADDPDAGLTLIMRACDGIAKLPYVTNKGRSAEGRSSERQVELELICRSEANLMRFASYAPEPEAPKPKPKPRTAGYVPRDRRELVQALRSRIFLLEVEESEFRAQILLDEIHEYSNGTVAL